MPQIGSRAAARPLRPWDVIDGRTYWISAMLRVRKSWLRAGNDHCSTGHDRAAQGMIGRAVALVEHLPCDKFYYLGMRA